MYFISNDLNEIEQIKKSCNKIKIKCFENKKIIVYTYYILGNKFSMILKRIIYYFKV